MFSLRAILSSALLAAAPAAALLAGMTAPDSAAAGATIELSFRTASYSQNWDDFGIVFGLASPGLYAGCSSTCTDQVCNEGCIGTLIGWKDIYKQEVLGTNVTAEVTIPGSQPAGDYVLVAGEYFNVGASGTVSTRFFSQNITITSS